MNIAHKGWISPFLTVSYCVVSITGVLMIFHLKFPGIYPLHKWGGFLFVLIGILHLILNWRILINYFKKKNAMVASTVAIVLCILIAAAMPSKNHLKRLDDGFGRSHQYSGGKH